MGLTLSNFECQPVDLQARQRLKNGRGPLWKEISETQEVQTDSDASLGA